MHTIKAANLDTIKEGKGSIPIGTMRGTMRDSQESNTKDDAERIQLDKMDLKMMKNSFNEQMMQEDVRNI